MKLKNILLLPISLMLSVVGCAGIGPNATYYMATTSFLYDLSYNSYDVQLNGKEIGGGFGNATTVTEIKVGPQMIKWRESNSDKKHQAKNQIILKKEDLKGQKYLALHIYPDDTVEIITSVNWPNSTEKGLLWLDRLRESTK